VATYGAENDVCVAKQFVTATWSDSADYAPAIDAGIDEGDRRARNRRVVDPCSGSPLLDRLGSVVEP